VSRPLIKICGITTAEDAHYCQAAGTDYLGLIFAESPRQVTPQGGAGIRAAVPDARLVGVFVNPLLSELQAIAPVVGLDLIQLHGDESPQFCREVKAELGIGVIKRTGPPREEISSWLTSSAARLVFDYLMFDLPKSKTASSVDYSAQKNLWASAATAGAEGLQVFLAGDLNETNVVDAIACATPYAVDVCRGVEAAPGVKDRQKVDRFIRGVRQ
jgi:phosphoribosylanthranilate isomerase